MIKPPTARRIAEEGGTGVETVTIADRDFFLNDEEHDALWLPAFEAADFADLRPLIALLLSDYALLPAQRRQFADLLDRHQLKKRSRGKQSPPIYDCTRRERQLLLGRMRYRKLRIGGMSAEDAVRQSALAVGVEEKPLSDFVNGRGWAARRDRKLRSTK